MSNLLDQFARKYEPVGTPSQPGPELNGVSDPLFQEFWTRFNGCLVGDGLFQIFTPELSSQWHDQMQQFWPEFPFRGLCFGANSLGQIFFAEPGIVENSKLPIGFFSPTDGDVSLISDSMEEFIGQTISDSEEHNEVFLLLFFKEWLADGNQPPKYGECLGYVRPLFFGGKDVNENMEIIDMDVYWTVTGAIINKIRRAAR